MSESPNTNNILAHTKWNCKYHIVFCPKYRRKVFYEQHREEIREILRKLCQWKGVEILKGLLRRYGWERYESNKRVYSQPVESG